MVHSLKIFASRLLGRAPDEPPRTDRRPLWFEKAKSSDHQQPHCASIVTQFKPSQVLTVSEPQYNICQTVPFTVELPQLTDDWAQVPAWADV